MHDWPAIRLPGSASSLAGLGGGLVLGGLLQNASGSWLEAVDTALAIAGGLWLNALQMIVFPLVIGLLVAAIASRHSARVVGRVGGASLAVFVIMLVITAVYTSLAAPPLIALVPVDAEMVSSMKTVVPEAARQAALRAPMQSSLSEWIVALIPTNPLRALVEGNLLQVMVFTIPFALAVTFLKPRPQRRLGKLFEAFAQTMMVMVGWILLATPVAVFALSFSFARESGFGVAGILAAFAVIVSGLLLVGTVLLYPIAILVGRVTPLAFARAVFPGQIVAVTTRSSLASLPALMAAAHHVRMPETIRGFVLPLSASVFKMSTPISSPVKLLFLAHVYGVPIGPAEYTVFVVTILILSFSTVGIPGGTPFKSLPVYLAAGIPIEGVVLLQAVDVIPDVFKTLVNTTGYMTVATMLARLSGERRAETPTPETAVAPEA